MLEKGPHVWTLLVQIKYISCEVVVVIIEWY